MWMSHPRKVPHIDPLVGVGDPESGPYFETDLVYFPYSGDGTYDERLFSLYLSATYLRDICSRQGSPAAFVPKDEYDALIRSHHEFAERIADLSAQLETANAALHAERLARKNDDVSELADQVAERLVAKNIGRRPGRPKSA